MKIHYFQRYHSKENVDTSNTMLLFSRLYYYSSDKFHTLLRELVTEEITNFETEMVFTLQERNANSVPDATIRQNSFKVVIETKRYDSFRIDQIRNHLDSFNNEDYKILITLSPYPLNNQMKQEIKNEVDSFNITKTLINEKRALHRHCTFSDIVSLIGDVLDERDYEFQDILNDYKDYCVFCSLIKEKNRWMRAITAGVSFESNLKFKLYYDPQSRGFSEHGYIGLYKQKAIRAIGRLENIIEANYIEGQLIIKNSDDPVTEEQKLNIISAVLDAKQYGWDISLGHNFFCVDNFYETEYVKNTPYPLQRTKFFDLYKILNDNREHSTEEIAKLINQKIWE